MKKIIIIVVAMLVAAILFIILRKKPNETIAPTFIDSTEIYKAKKDSAKKIYMDADSVYRSDITDDERAKYKSELIRKIITGQRDSVRKTQTGSLDTSLRL